MAQGQNAEKWGRPGKDWWGKRPFAGIGVSINRGMKNWKRLLHKAERREGKQQCNDK